MNHKDPIEKHIIIWAVALVVTLGLLYGAITVSGGVMPNYSDGVRTGKLIKISKKGIIWSSWEGQLLLNDFAMGKEGSNVFHFSCRDDTLGEELRKRVGRAVQIEYHQYLIGPMQQETTYTVTGVKE